MPFKINPFTNKPDYYGSGGSGSISAVEGQASLVAPTITVTTSASTATVENRAWETQYVVDASTTPGLRGTFTTIQDALNQAAMDGMGITTPRKILIRPGVYVEDLTIPDGAFFYSASLPGDPTQIPAFVSIEGTHTMSSFFSTNGIQWDNTTSSFIFTTFSSCFILASNSIFSNTGGGGIIDSSSGFSTQLFWDNCVVNAAQFSTGFNLSSVSGGWIKNCVFNTVGVSVTGGNQFYMQDCKDVGPITLASNANIVARNCNFTSNNSSCISGIGIADLINCGFLNNDVSFPAVDVSARMTNCYITPGATSPIEFCTPGNLLGTPFLQGGNVLKAQRFTIDVTASDTYQVNYLGITDTSTARSVQLNSGSPIDYQIYVVDETGGAASNNITVTASSGNINGSASYVINTNYGSALFHFDGTNWFIISKA